MVAESQVDPTLLAYGYEEVINVTGWRTGDEEGDDQLPTGPHPAPGRPHDHHSRWGQNKPSPRSHRGLTHSGLVVAALADPEEVGGEAEPSPVSSRVPCARVVKGVGASSSSSS